MLQGSLTAALGTILYYVHVSSSLLVSISLSDPLPSLPLILEAVGDSNEVYVFSPNIYMLDYAICISKQH